ncbi:MAG TPA: DinB family protein, partial [Flavisolibacter sp.]|nr:DinB family protein [Flavisolibacter sp.]
VPEFYHKYINLVLDDDLQKALSENTLKLIPTLGAIPADKWNYRYAEGKWTINELVQHMIDTERIFSYRALCFARGEQKPLPGFDENSYAAASNANSRSKDDLIIEFKAVRRSTELLFQSFSEEHINAIGTSNNNPISVNAIGFITAGHAQHHLNILKERYLQ